MQMIMHNGIHYVPATELAKANDKIGLLDHRVTIRDEKIESMQDRISALVFNLDELEAAAQQLICDIKNKRGVIVDTEA